MLSDDLIEKISRDLEAKYTEKGWQNQWTAEKDVLLEISFDILEKPAEKRFTYESACGVGATGVVLHVHDEVMEAERAMKLPRPRRDKAEEIREAFTGEIQKLLALNHQNIVKIYHRGDAYVRLKHYPFFLMEFVEDGYDLLDSLREDVIVDSRAFLDSIRQAVAGLDFLHSRGIVHFDIKPGNILVSQGTGQTMITDLGFSQDLSKIQSGSPVIVRFTRNYAHPDLRAAETSGSKQVSSDSQAARAQIKTDDFGDAAKCQIYDRFALGQTIFELLALENCTAIRKLTRYERRYLSLIAARLLDGHNPDDRLWEAMPRSTLKELSYENTGELKADTERLIGEYAIERDIPELNTYIPDVIQIPAVFKVPFTDRVKRIIEHPAFRRLAQVSQLGLLTHVYPSACHTRFEHALGAFATTCEYIRALHSDEGSPMFRSIMRRVDIETVLLASLLHDIGQYPLAHDLEDVCTHVFGHQSFGADILDGAITPTGVDSSIWEAIDQGEAGEPGWNVDRGVLRHLIDPSSTESLTFRERILKAIINGPIDADKIDYIYRDSVHLGIPFGSSVDLPRLMKCLTIASRPNDGSPILGIVDKGRVVGDAVGFARYALFSAGYWHHTARAIKAMIHHIVNLALAEHHIANLALAQPSAIAEFRSEFAGFAFECGQPAQLELMPQERRFIFDSQVRREDIEVLHWLARKSGKAAASGLAQDLAQRALYKRLLEFSSEDEIWDGIREMKLAGFAAFEACRTAFEGKILQILPPDLRQTLKPKAKDRPLVLIDSPWHPGDKAESSLVVRRGPDGAEEIIETSELLRLLYDDEFFQKRVSRLRVFVNWRIRDDLRPFVRAIEEAFRSVVADQGRRRR